MACGLACAPHWPGGDIAGTHAPAPFTRQLCHVARVSLRAVLRALAPEALPHCASAAVLKGALRVSCSTDFEGYDEEETVRVVFQGNQTPKQVELTQAAMECDADELSKRIEMAMKDAHAKCVPACN